MTDQEVICTFMEAHPVDNDDLVLVSDGGWWRRGIAVSRPGLAIYGLPWHPLPLTLDALHEVQERLSDEQWRDCVSGLVWHEDLSYIKPARLSAAMCLKDMKLLVHATAEQKVKALAAVLRASENA